MLDESTYRRIKKEYGFPAYIFDSDRFCENYRLLTEGMSAAYAPYRAAYSYKTNYTPRIVSLVRSLGGMAEVVSGMEYALARRVGNAPENILFNGPCKGEDGIAALLDGACVIIDNAEELAAVLRAASAPPGSVCHTARGCMSISAAASLALRSVRRAGVSENARRAAARGGEHLL